MSWARLDDAMLDNPKILQAGPIAFALHVAGILHCSRNLTDGFVSYAVARRLLTTSWTEDAEGGKVRVQSLAMVSGHVGCDGAEAIEHTIGQLCDAGLWEITEHGYFLHDYLDYNPSREQVLAEREARHVAKVRAGSIGGRVAAERRRQRKGDSQAESDAIEYGNQAEAQQNTQQSSKQKGQHRSSPVPVPVPRVNEDSPNGESGRSDRVLSVFTAWQESTGKGGCKLTHERRDKITARLRIYPLEDVLDAVRGWEHDPWPERIRQNELTILLRSDAQCEKFRDLWRAPVPVAIAEVKPLPENPIDRRMRAIGA